MGKIKRQISRVSREAPSKIGRFALDFHDVEEDNNGIKSTALFTDRKTGIIFDYYLADRTTSSITTLLKGHLESIKKLGVATTTLKLDNEVLRHHVIKDWLENDESIKIEPSAPYTQTQNSAAKRSGGIIFTKAKYIRTQVKLPLFL